MSVALKLMHALPCSPVGFRRRARRCQRSFSRQPPSILVFWLPSGNVRIFTVLLSVTWIQKSCSAINGHCTSQTDVKRTLRQWLTVQLLTAKYSSALDTPSPLCRFPFLLRHALSPISPTTPPLPYFVCSSSAVHCAKFWNRVHICWM